MYKQETGIKGELAAQSYLVEIGYNIIDKNINYPNVGELDIVAMDGQTMVFVEVRTRADNMFGHPFETVNKAKQQKIIRASRRYILENKPKCKFFRYDVIAVIYDKVEHLQNAFLASWK